MYKKLLIILIAILSTVTVAYSDTYVTADSTLFQKLIARCNDTIKTHPYIALEYAAQARQIAEQTGDSLCMAVAYKTLGHCYYRTRVYYLAMDLQFKAYDIYARLNNLNRLASCYVDIAQTYCAQEVYKMAEEYCGKALEICKNNNFPEVKADAYATLGHISINTNEKVAIPNMFKAKNIYDSLGLVNRSIDININLAQAYSRLYQPDSALNLLEYNLEKYVLTGEKGNIARTHLALGDTYDGINDKGKASTYYKTALKQFSSCGMIHEALGCRLKTAEIQFNNKEYDNALSNATQTIEEAQVEEIVHGTEEMMIKHLAYNLIYRIHQILGNHDLAIKNCEKFAETGDSVYYLKRQEQYSEFQVSMESQRLQKEIEMIQLNAEKEKLLLEKKQYNRNVMFLAIIIALIITVVIIFYYRYKEKTRNNTALSLTNSRLEQEIKERKIAEAELRNSEEKYKLLFRETPVGIIQFNEKFVITAANERFTEIFNIKNKSIIGQDVYSIIPQKAFEGFNPDNDNDKETRHEAKIQTQSGEVHISITSKSYRYNTGTDVEKGGILILEDITERKKAESDRETFDAVSDNIINMLPETVYLLDSKGNYIFARIPNVSFNEQNSYIGKNIREMLPPDLLLQYLVAFNTVRKTGETQYAEYQLDENDNTQNYEARFLKCDGDRVLVTVRDISRQKLAEQKLKKAKYNAESGSKAKSEFLLGMTAEFKAPLETILLNCEQLAANISDAESSSQLRKILNSALFVNETFNDILKLTEVETINKPTYTKKINPVSVAKDVFEIFRKRAEEKNLQYDFSANDNLPQLLMLDEIRLRQILFNIISNAVKYTEKGGVKVHITTNQTNDNTIDLIFSVTDTGVGLSDNQIENIFSPENGRKGMVLTKKMVDTVNGTISIESKENEGSTFTFTLPNLELSKKKVTNPDQDSIHALDTKLANSTRHKNYVTMREYVSVLKHAVIPEYKTMKNQISFELLTDFTQRFKIQSENYHIEKGILIADELLKNIKNYDIPNITTNIRKLETYIHSQIKELQSE